MNILIATFLGFIQGLTEFFPVSSSGHLVLMPYIFRFKDPGLTFSVALHAGTLLAILWVFKEDWLKMLVGITNKDKKQINLFLLLAITTVPGAIAGYFLESQAETIFRNPIIVAINLVLFGFIMWLVDEKATQAKTINQMSKKHAFLIGICQALAIVPGISRSGATVTAGRILGFKREESFRYSFLAAAPIIFGATIFSTKNISVTNLLSVVWVLGFIASFVTSIWAMKFLIRYVKTHSFKLFFRWRLILAVIVIVLYLSRG